MLEDHIFDALSFRGGIAGMGILLYNCSSLPLQALKKKFKSLKVSTWATHEIVWDEDKVSIYESSGITSAEDIFFTEAA